MEAVRTVLELATQLKLKVDIKSTFLNGELEKVYMDLWATPSKEKAKLIAYGKHNMN